jgi:hypothetical protein
MLISFKLIKKILSKKLNSTKLEKTQGNCVIFKMTKKFHRKLKNNWRMKIKKKSLKNPKKTK